MWFLPKTGIRSENLQLQKIYFVIWFEGFAALAHWRVADFNHSPNVTNLPSFQWLRLLPPPPSGNRLSEQIYWSDPDLMSLSAKFIFFFKMRGTYFSLFCSLSCTDTSALRQSLLCWLNDTLLFTACHTVCFTFLIHSLPVKGELCLQ